MVATVDAEGFGQILGNCAKNVRAGWGPSVEASNTIQIASPLPMNDTVEPHPIASAEDWLKLRRELLRQEKALTRARDALTASIRALPWTRVEQDYVFADESGAVTLGELFGDCSQLVVRHFMYGPDWEDPCKGCSFASDQLDGALVHLANHNVSYAAVSRATVAQIAAARRRFGWRFRWVSAEQSTFNHDFAVSFTEAEQESGEKLYNYGSAPAFCDELPGISVFFRDDDGAIFHTYSTYGRGLEAYEGAYMMLDIMPHGRAENGPHFSAMDWLQLRDRY